MISNIKWLVTLFFVLISDVIKSPVPKYFENHGIVILKVTSFNKGYTRN